MATGDGHAGSIRATNERPLNVEIRADTSRRRGRYKADHRATTESVVADAALSSGLAERITDGLTPKRFNA
jgi:hypothetical protein